MRTEKYIPRLVKDGKFEGDIELKIFNFEEFIEACEGLELEYDEDGNPKIDTKGDIILKNKNPFKLVKLMSQIARKGIVANNLKDSEGNSYSIDDLFDDPKFGSVTAELGSRLLKRGEVEKK